MKKRPTRINRLIFSVAIISLAIMMLSEISPTAGNPTTFYLDPLTISQNTGGQFTLTLKVDVVTDMYLWVVTIEWDPAYFDLVGNPVEGGCLKYGGSTTFLWGSITDGKIEGLTCTLLGENPGANVPSAPRDLATIKFLTQKRPPESGTEIRMTLGRYRDSAGTAYYPITVDTVVSPPSVGGLWFPIDEVGLLVPYVGLASAILVAVVATAVYVKHRKEKQ